MFDVEELNAEMMHHLQRHSELLLRAPARDLVETIAAAANDQDVNQRTLEDCIQTVYQLLFTSAYGGDYVIPSHFWQTPLGQAVMQAKTNVTGDEVITISEAASILFGSNNQVTRMRVKRMIERGELIAYVDPDEKNPQKNSRLFRSEVESARRAT